MKKLSHRMAVLVACLSLAWFTGCGGNEDDDTPPPGANNPNPPPSTNTNSTVLAPASLGGKTLDGRIGDSDIDFEIVLDGESSGTGSFAYSEEGNPLYSGTYTYTKASDTTGVLNLSPDTVIDLTFDGSNRGSYAIPSSGETGTFTLN